MNIHYFQHVPFEGLGSIEDWIRGGSYVLGATRFYRDEPLPAVEGVDLLVVMGGPMNIYEEANYRWFAEEKRFIERAITAGKRALVAFRGGYGTLDELFEVLTLVQTGKMARIPIVLVGREFWRRAVDFDYLVDEGFISAQDVRLFTRVDAAEEIVAVLEAFYGGKPPGPEAAQG